MININQYFNGLNIRIIGTNEVPMFYANDIGKILGIDKIRNTINTFGPNDLVSPEQRKQYNVITYRSNGKKDHKIHLLTLQGVIRLINISRKSYAEDFRVFIAALVNSIRLNQEEETNIKLEFNDLEVKEDSNQITSSYITHCSSNQPIIIQTKLYPLYIFEYSTESIYNQQYLDDPISDSDDSDIDSDNILYIRKMLKKYPNDPYWKEQFEQNSNSSNNSSISYLITTEYTKNYNKYKIYKLLYCIDPVQTIKYLRKQWGSFVGSSKQYTQDLLLTMEPEFMISDLENYLS